VRHTQDDLDFPFDVPEWAIRPPERSARRTADAGAAAPAPAPSAEEAAPQPVEIPPVPAPVPAGMRW